MKNIKILQTSINGKLFRCNCCDKIYLKFKNLVFNFNNNKFNEFVDYLISIDCDQWKEKNKNSLLSRKIALSINHKNILFDVDSNEIEEIKELVLHNTELNNQYVFGLLNKSLCLN